MVDTVIFDMDGLMIDSERETYKVFQEIFDEMGLDYNEQEYLKCLGMNRESFYKLMIETFGQSFPNETFWKTSKQKLDERLQQHIPIKKGLLELLDYLKTYHYKTIVASSSERERVEFILQEAHIEHYFDDIICGDEVSKGKPDPEIFIKACQKLHSKTQNALVLEDSEFGIKAAYKANIKVIAIPDMKVPNNKDLCIKTYPDLTYVIEYLKKNKR